MNIKPKTWDGKGIMILAALFTRPKLSSTSTSSSCGGLQPSAKVCLFFGQKKVYYAMLAHFSPFLVFCTNLGNF